MPNKCHGNLKKNNMLPSNLWKLLREISGYREIDRVLKRDGGGGEEKQTEKEIWHFSVSFFLGQVASLYQLMLWFCNQAMIKYVCVCVCVWTQLLICGNQQSYCIWTYILLEFHTFPNRASQRSYYKMFMTVYACKSRDFQTLGKKNKTKIKLMPPL